MAKFKDFLNPFGKKNPIWQGAQSLLMGSPEKRENVSTLRPEQEGLYQQSVNAGMGRGAGGAFGDAADYYRNNLSNDPADFNAFAAPELRRYNQDIAPGIAEQYAGMGAGGLSSSGFQNAQIQGATDLSERLGAIRAGLRENAAQGLSNIGQIGLRNYSQNMVTEPGTQGLLAPALGAVGTAIGGPVLGAASAAAGNYANNWFGGKGNKVSAKTSPYGSNTTGASSPSFRDVQFGQRPGGR